MVDPDARDERLAAWLEPEPLDDVTRRRLVSTAMQETKPSNAGRWIATAAAIVVLLVGGLALLTAQGGHDEHQAATPAVTPSNDRAAAGATPSSAADSAVPEASGNSSGRAAAAPAPTDVGNFGDLDRAANLAHLRSALEGNGSAFASGKAASGSDTGALTALAALPCRDRLPRGTVLAVGAGTLGGRAAVVVLTDLGGGTRSIDAVLADPCAIRPLS
jgi:hypothetical protein